jgi:D-amino-acid oxidase
VWLRNLVASKGARFINGRIHGDLLDSEDELLAEHLADAIVNATGLNSKELAADSSVFPLRGALIRLVNDGKKFPKVTEALCVAHNENRGDDEDIVFIVPRNDSVRYLSNGLYL